MDDGSPHAKDTSPATAEASLEDDALLRAGRADVFKVRDRSRRRRIIRLIALFLLVDGYLWWRYATFPEGERDFAL